MSKFGLSQKRGAVQAQSRRSPTVPFWTAVVAGLLHPVSFALVLALIRRIGPVDYGNRTRGEREKANLPLA